MDNFDGIIEFVSVAESQGFSTAAKQLGCSTSHVSRQISKLEARLGSALFARTTRLVSLTPAGLNYYHQCRDLVTGLQVANEQISTQQLKLMGTLRVSAAGNFAEQQVAPVLIEFALQHPDLSIEINFNTKKVNFVEDSIDFAIRYGKLEDSGLIARKLLAHPMMAVASESYLAKYGIPKHPNELKNHSCIVSNNDHWLFEHQGYQDNIKVHGRWKSNNAHAVISACEQGLGIAYMPQRNFSRSIKLGKLTPILAPFWRTDSHTWVVYQNRRFLPMRARLAIDHLLAHFAQ
ncbi:LysR family transcriptional regulator [Shewanella sp. D64]|uniref:LysR family transcriptional regulator n=1 Tax=unclassified Shewanella TaxID=196818 RepID=UPI0022BA23D4|nr:MULTISPECIES: LysR family transcriptional regulator [unclassified Shewanella]MEC4724465.1 LysR family transcriptional regulator [Shewanella sp. D64]MEC4736758.1 LysR family transcriptional regulator [Shewanella sp. E94]WBJ98269.1 LysR family transcriptional regulator [Shewanella sp. MTB7]